MRSQGIELTPENFRKYIKGTLKAEYPYGVPLRHRPDMFGDPEIVEEIIKRAPGFVRQRRGAGVENVA